MSIAYWKFIKIILPEFGGKDKRKKQKKSGNMGFKEFPRPLKPVKWRTIGYKTNKYESAFT
jgi:hypothetical protein